jgi:uncharacterized protein
MNRVAQLQCMLLDMMDMLDKDTPRDETLSWERLHMASSARIAWLLALERGADPELCAATAAVHDFGRIVSGLQENHAEAGYVPVQGFLQYTGLFTEDEIAVIALAVRNHSSKTEVGTDIEEIVKDADVIDCYQYGLPFDRPEKKARYEAWMAGQGKSPTGSYEIAELTSANRGSVDRHIRDEWGGPMIVTLGNLYDSSKLPGYAAVRDNEVVGAVLYRPNNGDCEIAVLYSLIDDQGIGTSLMNRAVEAACELGTRRVWLVTTNDNTRAIRYYQKYGFSLKAVHIGALNVTRELKKGLPERGIDDIPLLHEFEFELYLR